MSPLSFVYRLSKLYIHTIIPFLFILLIKLFLNECDSGMWYVENFACFVYKDGELSPEVDEESEGGDQRERVIDNAPEDPGERSDNQTGRNNQVYVPH